jgi:hypothetical protein
VLGGVRDGILALCAATMEEFPCTRPLRLDMQTKDDTGSVVPAAAAQSTVFNERGTGEISLCGAAALAACAAQQR